MRNISTEGQDVELSPQRCYYIIDALYLDTIKTKFIDVNINDLDKEIEEKIFPYTEAPFAKIISDSFFQIKSIEKAVPQHDTPYTKNFFSSDTGLLIFIKEDILLDFLEVYDYDKMVDVAIDINNGNYWDEMISRFGFKNIGLVVAPGINSNYDFTGSGFYFINS